MNSHKELWQKILSLLENELSKTTIDTFIRNSVILDIRENTLLLQIESEFNREMVRNRYREHLKRAMKELFSEDFEVNVLSPEEGEKLLNQMKRQPEDPFSGEEFTFEKFIVGNSNQMAYAAARSVAENRGSTYNPLLIYGESGLGKTHLLYSIAHEIRNNMPKSRIVYIKGDDFTNELIEAIRAGRTSEFRDKYRRADLLLVDDIQFIAGKTQTQEEFFHTFNALHEDGRQIVLTSDRPPKEMLRLEDRLRSRFEGGLLVDVQPPDYETRVAIVRTKASRMGIPLSNEAGTYIAENVRSNVRQMEGILKKIRAYTEIQGLEAADMELVRKITKDVIDTENSYTPDYIIGKVAEFHNITREELLGASRAKNVVQARQLAMYLVRKLTPLSLADIGKSFNRDHTTVLHSLNTIESRLPNSPELSDTVRDITSNITNR